VLSRAPYDGTDVVWNALRLASTAVEAGMRVRLFLMNEGVDLARVGVRPEGAEVRLCQTCLTRCLVGRGETMAEAQVAGMGDLVAWLRDSEKVLSF
jgi:sulfur relay (sulfurtransferase) complex TusBCD TusD component (DsrE family)